MDSNHRSRGACVGTMVSPSQQQRHTQRNATQRNATQRNTTQRTSSGWRSLSPRAPPAAPSLLVAHPLSRGWRDVCDGPRPAQPRRGPDLETEGHARYASSSSLSTSSSSISPSSLASSRRVEVEDRSPTVDCGSLLGGVSRARARACVRVCGSFFFLFLFSIARGGSGMVCVRVWGRPPRAPAAVQLADATPAQRTAHDELMANFFAQPDALAAGKTFEEVASERASERPAQNNRPGTHRRRTTAVEQTPRRFARTRRGTATCEPNTRTKMDPHVNRTINRHSLSLSLSLSLPLRRRRRRRKRHIVWRVAVIERDRLRVW